MPYIDNDDRLAIEETLLEDGVTWTPDNAGQLNFVVSSLINNYLQANGLKYANINDMMGALTCIQMELYRVVAGPYEDEKVVENGGVYTAQDTSKDY